MIVKRAKFIVSAEKLSQCPDFKKPEIALIGRSNVGKSSFINAITNNSKLAKTSNKPGKTRLINLFDFDDKYIVADLPGYGYAKVSKEMQEKWRKNLEDYLMEWKNKSFRTKNLICNDKLASFYWKIIIELPWRQFDKYRVVCR